MKIRNGFVSNSSSSSFILKLDSIPTSPEDLKEMIFGDDVPDFITHWDDEAYSTDRLCGIVYNDIIDSLKENDVFDDITVHKYNINDFGRYVKPEFFDDFRDLKDELISHEENTKFWDIKDDDLRSEKIRTHYEKSSEIRSKIEKIVIESLKDIKSILCKVKYSDNDGTIMSFIEHSEFLDPITLVKISNH